jgi:hypothetical protein
LNVLEKIDRQALFHEIHRSIEEAATATVERISAGEFTLTYPPNHGFSSDELAALELIPITPAMTSALRKLFANAAAYPVFHLFSLADGVADPPVLSDVQKSDHIAAELMLHDGFYESYWAWRCRRPDPGWRLDTFEDE